MTDVSRDLSRLLRPRSIAVIGGGSWCANVIEQCERIGFRGDIWPVHPTREQVRGRTAVSSVAELPGSPDAAFVGVNRSATVEVVGQLSAAGAGGAVCFASGFQEAAAELDDGAALQADLLARAADMPILGPNCYGLLNLLDGAALWPDQHGAARCDSGVAILTQSSNIAINLTMQRRGLPVSYVVTVGNQAQTDMAAIASGLIEDPRVTALGLYVEGIADLEGFQRMALRAAELGKPIVALKVGASEQAQVGTQSHTASLAGSQAGARALFDRLGIALVGDLETLISALMLLHVAGPLRSNRIGSLSCSGGEASLMADSALGFDLEFPPLTDAQRVDLRAALGPRVALANPLDYHTYIWGDLPAITRCFSAMLDPGLALAVVVLDIPREDRCDASAWTAVIDAAAAAQAARGVPMAILASLPETLPEGWAEEVAARGLVPLAGIPAALGAIEAATRVCRAGAPVWLPGQGDGSRRLDESAAKAELAAHGLDVPARQVAASPSAAGQAAAAMGGTVVLKGQGFAHKTEAGAVALGLSGAAEVQARAEQMAAPQGFLVEEQITGGLVELLVGVTRDPAHGFVLTLGAGGTLTEVLQDSQQALLPVAAPEIEAMLDRLRIAPVLRGYRGASPVDRAAIVRAVLAVQAYVEAHRARVTEVEVNPLICSQDRAIAVDALIVLGEDT